MTALLLKFLPVVHRSRSRQYEEYEGRRIEVKFHLKKKNLIYYMALGCPYLHFLHFPVNFFNIFLLGNERLEPYIFKKILLYTIIYGMKHLFYNYNIVITSLYNMAVEYESELSNLLSNPLLA